jgi:RNA polymerase sigma factor (sigma-70 family)
MMGPIEIGTAPITEPAPTELEQQGLLADLFRTHGKRLQRYFRRRGHGADDAQDLVQDVFVRLARCDLDLIKARPGCMVFRLAHFVSVDARRRLKLQSQIGLAPWDSLGEIEVDDEQPSPEQRLVWRQTIAGAMSAIQRLPPKGGRAYWLYRVGEFSQREIADIQGVSLKTVEKQIAVSAGRFRAMLAAEANEAA